MCWASISIRSSVNKKWDILEVASKKNLPDLQLFDALLSDWKRELPGFAGEKMTAETRAKIVSSVGE